MKDQDVQWNEEHCNIGCSDQWEAAEAAIAREYGEEIRALMPKLQQPDYFTEPRVQQLAAREHAKPGYCSKVNEFTVGRKGYGSIKFLGETDVRWLDLVNIVFFGMREVFVYLDNDKKPLVGQGLNKPAEVILGNVACRSKVTDELVCEGPELESFEKRLVRKTKEQDAEFISYDAFKQEWKFRVKHFSRFGLDDSDDEEEEEPAKDSAIVPLTMDGDLPEDEEIADLEEPTENVVIWQPEKSEICSEDIEAEGSPMQDINVSTSQSALAHSLPLQLRLDPLKMQQMRMLFFSSGEEPEDVVLPGLVDKVPFQPLKVAAANNIVIQSSPSQRKTHHEDSPKNKSFSKHSMKISPQASWKRTPDFFASPLRQQMNLDFQYEDSPGKHTRMLLSIEGKGERGSAKKSRIGFKKELSSDSCMFGRSHNIVDAAMFLGNSFRVGWGPHGLLAHSGNPVGSLANDISSLICLEKVALDGCVRDEQGNVREDLIELHFISPLNLHISISRIVDDKSELPSGVQLRYVLCNRVELPTVCSKYEDLIVKQHAVEGLSVLQRLVLQHQVMVWQLINVLFSDKPGTKGQEIVDEEDAQDTDEMKVWIPNNERELKALVRRAEFSSWLQDSVRNSIQEELMTLEVNDQLKEIFSLLTGRQLDDAVQVAAARGDVRLSCLISQAGGSMVTRKDIASQLKIWTEEGLDFSLIEKGRLQLYKLLSGDIQGALVAREIDWKRFLGLLMWYQLAPDTQLCDIIKAYCHLVDVDAAPQPIPLYVEEGAFHGMSRLNQQDLFDMAYYLMRLHANQRINAVDTQKMFSSFSSTYDPLDHRMAWLQHGLLQSIGVLGPLQLHILDMNFIAQLLSVGQCHWAIYVALHMPTNRDHPGLHERVVKEILNQYCEVWSTSELQQSFLEEELGVPIEWLHEALGTYWQYMGDLHKALKHFLKSRKWDKAHSLLMVSVAASLFLTGQHEELLEHVSHMERNKMELDNWDFGGGIYAEFYMLKNSFRMDGAVEVLETFENKSRACKLFFQHLKDSQHLWQNRWSSENRVTYSRMASELTTLLLAKRKSNWSYSETDELKLYNIVLDAPVPEDVRFRQLQGAAAAFTSWLLETASS